jgi:glycosyltransferase involved in cell wall biosynthesis
MSFLKRLLPKSFIQFLWFVFKSPQRKWIGFLSVISDLKAWFSTRKRPNNLQAISVCVGIKNRSHNLLNYVIPSLNLCHGLEMIELSVFDCGSDDMHDLESEIRKLWKGKLVYKQAPQKFARSISFNAAVKQSTNNLILICDADMSLPQDVLEKVNRYIGKYSAWFPQIWFCHEDGTGHFMSEGTGIMASQRQQFLDLGGYDESITEWGKEDWLLFFEFYKKGIGCMRSNEPNFIHHYHESLKPEGFIPLF